MTTRIVPATTTPVEAVPATPRAALSVEVADLTKTFRRANGTTVTPIDDVSLQIDQGEFVVLLGPSGCGKTTLLRCIAGLEVPDRGRIDVHGRTVFSSDRRVNEPPERRKLGMIFQSYALWPHLTVRENVAYPLKAAKVAKRDIAGRVEAALETVGVLEVIDQHPGRLSGGQQQRVALARALVGEPALVLFDEPLSNVDAKVREELRVELVEMQARLGFTALYVTHDQAEAMELADRIAVLREGRVEQLASPREVYRNPATRYVAHFVGTANEITGVVATAEDGSRVISTDFGVLKTGRELPAAPGEAVRVVWRPEQTRVATGPDSVSEGVLQLRAKVVVHRYLGAMSELFCRTAEDVEIRVLSSVDMPHSDGDEVVLQVSAPHLNVYPA
jgi:iron(III) transport system ATP-binding protein